MHHAMMTFNGAERLSSEVDAWLDTREAVLGEIARVWFGKLRACGDDVTELVHDGLATACVGDAPFAYVDVFSKHVNLGFFYGSELPDPAHLLEGTGKRMRHVKLRPGIETPTAALDDLIDAAYADLKERLR